MSLMRIMDGDTLRLANQSKVVLSMTEQQNGNSVLVILEGSLSSLVVHDFYDEMAALAVMGIDIEINFQKVTNISSACIQSLLQIQQKMDKLAKGTLTLKSIPREIYVELESTGVTELLMIEE